MQKLTLAIAAFANLLGMAAARCGQFSVTSDHADGGVSARQSSRRGGASCSPKAWETSSARPSWSRPSAAPAAPSPPGALFTPPRTATPSASANWSGTSARHPQIYKSSIYDIQTGLGADFVAGLLAAVDSRQGRDSAELRQRADRLAQRRKRRPPRSVPSCTGSAAAAQRSGVVCQSHRRQIRLRARIAGAGPAITDLIGDTIDLTSCLEASAIAALCHGAQVQGVCGRRR